MFDWHAEAIGRQIFNKKTMERARRLFTNVIVVQPGSSQVFPGALHSYESAGLTFSFIFLVDWPSQLTPKQRLFLTHELCHMAQESGAALRIPTIGAIPLLGACLWLLFNVQATVVPMTLLLAAFLLGVYLQWRGLGAQRATARFAAELASDSLAISYLSPAEARNLLTKKGNILPVDSKLDGSQHAARERLARERLAAVAEGEPYPGLPKAVYDAAYFPPPGLLCMLGLVLLAGLFLESPGITSLLCGAVVIILAGAVYVRLTRKITQALWAVYDTMWPPPQ